MFSVKNSTCSNNPSTEFHVFIIYLYKGCWFKIRFCWLTTFFYKIIIKMVERKFIRETVFTLGIQCLPRDYTSPSNRCYPLQPVWSQALDKLFFFISTFTIPNINFKVPNLFVLCILPHMIVTITEQITWNIRSRFRSMILGRCIMEFIIFRDSKKTWSAKKTAPILYYNISLVTRLFSQFINIMRYRVHLFRINQVV